MRPPMPLQSATALQQNEAFQQSPPATQQLQLQPSHTATQPQLGLGLELTAQSTHKAKLPPLELLVEHKLSYSSAATYQQQQQQQQDSRQSNDLRTQSQLKRSSISSPSSSEDCQTAARASIFDDAAENFIINFPAESSSQQLQLLPLSETVPLLTHIEATVVDKQRSIRLNKNSASLIFTRKELNSNVASNCQRRQHHSLYGSGERQRKQTKHLPPTRGQQQRRSLQLNYSNNQSSNSNNHSNSNRNSNNNHNNNNLVTTAACAAASTAGPNNAANGGKLVPHKHHTHTHTHSHSHSHSHAHNHSHGHGHGVGLTSPTAANGAAGVAASARKQLSYSWYAPVYSALEEELEQDSRDSSPIHNLANTKHQQRASSQQSATASHAAPQQQPQQQQQPLQHSDSDTNETVALLETQTRNKINIISASDAGAERKASQPTRISLSLPHAPHNSHALSTSSLGNGNVAALAAGSGAALAGGGGGAVDVESSLGLSGGQLPRRRRFENFLKSLVGLKGSSSRSSERERDRERDRDRESIQQRPASPEIRITRTPSEQDVVLRDPSGRQQLANGHATNYGSRLSISGSSSSLNVVQQKLWHMMRREGSASSLHQEKSQSIVQYTGLRKCETVLALTRQSQSHSHSLHPMGASEHEANLLMAARHGGSGIFSAGGVEQIRPLNRLRNSVTSINATCSRCSSLLSLAATGSRYSLANGFVPRPESVQSLSMMPPRRTSCEESTTPEPHINVNAQIRLSNGSGCGSVNALGCGSRKSSAGLASVSPSPPSNVTTATLHSNSNNSNNNNNSVSIEEPPPTTTPSGEMGAFGTTHAYPLTVSSLLSMASANQAAQACCVRDGITLKRREMLASAEATPSAGTPATPMLTSFQQFTCKLCLIDVETLGESTTLVQCGCQFCTECMRAYVEFEITEGAYEISCPDAKCPAQGAISLPEIANLTTTNLLKKHHRYRLNREIELDKTRTWCPRAGCETICMVGAPAPFTAGTAAAAAAAATSPASAPAAMVGNGTGSICQMDESPSTSQSYTPQLEGVNTPSVLLSISVHCPSCKDEFCALCKKAYHPNISCEEFGRRLIADGQDDIGIPFDNELIKCCPMCAVPIEKDEGCAQMMCKRCKHVFCWYCLASLDDDFLLRHYDKGPCKNKLGHSRASVVWHRAQVIGIFAGFGILLLVASPLLLLAAPCIICCKCRGCSGSKIDEVDAELEEEVTALQG
ncbi:uncharacterized protein LOC133840825 [Drosophila sulfurigaster albostrigata]|uniref:uncharacterized protein LOC133840825 n=1 Tax=Drosophila sulfurigaster albostrigata TaxID=89887 RepID=UPI002D21CCC9|nr:uncharacterized protein LOC133840825 [Drosophila sulfurigaster albostrigata]XP_062128900.1 uncharacterized protein LOC133840825 [Drosophila sulfurigaster albostrigata]